MDVSQDKFLQEIKLKEEEDYKEFAKYQSLALNTLREVHEICKKNNIDYFLAYGSLLGAIRHRGLIPWDYDIDIWVRGEDIERFINALEEDLPDDYYFVCRYRDRSCRHYILRVAPKGYSSEVLHVDVYWLWEGGNEKKEIEKIHRKLRFHRYWMAWKLTDFVFLRPSGLKGIKMKLYKCFHLIAQLIPTKVLDSMYHNSIKKYKKGKFVSDEYETFEKKHFESGNSVEFSDGVKYFVPKEADILLKEMYGNYMQIAPVESRYNEMKSSLQRIKELAKHI